MLKKLNESIDSYLELALKVHLVEKVDVVAITRDENKEEMMKVVSAFALKGVVREDTGNRRELQKHQRKVC